MMEFDEKDPELNAENREIIKSVRMWSQESLSAAPTDSALLIASLDKRQVDETSNGGRSRLWTGGWVLATAALFFFALSTIDIQFDWGGTRMTIGEIKNDNQIMTLLQEHERKFNLEQAKHQRQIEAIGLKTVQLDALLRRTAQDLADRQYVESVTRFNDIQTLLSLSQTDIDP